MHRQGTEADQGHHLSHPEIIANIITKKEIVNMVADVHLPTTTFGEEKESGRKAEAEDDKAVVTRQMDDELQASTLAKLWQSWPRKRVIN